MTKSAYDDSLRRLLAHEGGYANHPSDPGGPTNFGITIYDYRKYVKPGATAADVRAMKVEEAKAIYRAKYWDAQRCDELPAGVDYTVFDYGVNSGIGRSGKVLRRCLKLPDTTSVVNDAVIAAARAAEAKTLIAAICDERLRFLQSLKTWRVFGGGWGRRVAEVKSVSLAMASGAPSPDLQTSTCRRPRRGAGCQGGAARFGRRGRCRGRCCGEPGACVGRGRGGDRRHPRPYGRVRYRRLAVLALAAAAATGKAGVTATRAMRNFEGNSDHVGQDQSLVQIFGDHSVGARWSRSPGCCWRPVNRCWPTRTCRRPYNRSCSRNSFRTM